MNTDNLQQLEKDVNRALSGLHTIMLAYGFNVVPMRESAKILLPGYSNQIADMLGMVNDHLTSANSLIKEARADE